MSIRTRLLALVIGTVIPIFILGLMVLRESWQTKQQRLNQVVEQQAKLAATVFEQWLSCQEQNLTIITSQSMERLEGNNSLKDYLQRVLIPRSHWIDLNIIDNQGRIIAAHSTGVAGLPDQLINKLHGEVRNKNRAIKTIWRPADQSYYLIIAVPIAEVGVAIARIEGAKLDALLRSIALPDQFELALLDADQKIIYSSKDGAALQGLNTGKVRILSPLDQQTTSIIVLQGPIDRIERVYGLSRVGETGFTLTISVSSEVLYTAARQQFWRYSSITFLMLIATIMATIFIYRSIAQPVRQLSIAVNRFAEEDFAARAPSHGEDEISKLGASFNALAEHLHKRDMRLIEMDRQKSEFVSIVSHELRTPLTTIKTLTRLLLRDGLSKTKRHEYLETIALECDRQIELVLNLLDLTRIEGGVFRITRERVDTEKVLIASVDAARRAAEARGHELQLELANNLPMAMADQRALRRVLVNIIENAIKYTPNGGRIIVSARLVDNRVAITVKDNGIGIVPEDLPPLFDKFHRGRRVINPEPDIGDSLTAAPIDEAEMGGVGLGLYLAHNIIERMGGSISVDSKVGEGSTFTVYLPLWTVDDNNGQVDQEQTDEQTITGR